MSSKVLFWDIFYVDKVDPVGKQHDKVSCIEATSEYCEMFMLLDVNMEIHPFKLGDKFLMALAHKSDLEGTPLTDDTLVDDKFTVEFGHKLNLDGTPFKDRTLRKGKGILPDKYDYVMHGKVHNVSDNGSRWRPKARIHVSYDGLQMMLQGEASHIAQFEPDQPVQILIETMSLNLAKIIRASSVV